MINLGDKVKDVVSGFVGIAVSRHSYLNGCARIGVQPEVDKDGKLPEYETFDEPQLQVIEKSKINIGITIEAGGPERYMPKSQR